MTNSEGCWKFLNDEITLEEYKALVAANANQETTNSVQDAAKVDHQNVTPAQTTTSSTCTGHSHSHASTSTGSNGQNMFNFVNGQTYVSGNQHLDQVMGLITAPAMVDQLISIVNSMYGVLKDSGRAEDDIAAFMNMCNWAIDILKDPNKSTVAAKIIGLYLGFLDDASANISEEGIDNFMGPVKAFMDTAGLGGTANAKAS